MFDSILLCGRNPSILNAYRGKLIMASFDPKNFPARKGEKPIAFAARLEAQGERELILRKALRAAFDLEIKEVIEICANCPKARRREIEILRENHPTLSQSRFAWRIGQSMTLAKPDAKEWADIIFDAEGAE
jgi:hypothetical protein